jgi:hypothetical protein
MKRAVMVWTTVVLMLFAACARLASQEKAPAPRLFFGPTVGAAAIIIPGGEFNSNMQSIYPASDRTYYPFFTLMGAQAFQLVPLGDSKNSLAFHEIFLMGGLDQSMPMPTLDVLFGYHTGGGFEIAIGPHFAVMSPNGSVKLSASVMYSVGWTLSMHGLLLPIKLALVPLPSYANPQLSLIVGFGFEAVE